MYQIGDRVVYGIHGVCVISGMEKKLVGKEHITYYVLEALDQHGSKLYLPVHNPAIVSKMRPLIDRQELDRLLRSPEVRVNCWTEDENSRKQKYRELIASGDRKSLLQMVYTLHEHKKQLQDSGRKFHLCDENFLRDAQKLLNSEFSKVLNASSDEVNAYITDVFDQI